MVLPKGVYRPDVIKVNLKPKPIEKPDKEISVPKTLKPVGGSLKPSIRLGISDYLNRIWMALAPLYVRTEAFLLKRAGTILRYAIPMWVWLFLIGAIVLCLIL